MSVAEGFVTELQQTQKFFKTATSIFEEGDSGFAPTPEMYTVAAHVEHVAGTIDWFLEGAFGSGWDMDFEKHIAEAKAATSLSAAREHLERAFANAVNVIGAASKEDLFAEIPNDTIMGGAPRAAVVTGITDHTAHHRGALTVYARLLGKEAPMAYA